MCFIKRKMEEDDILYAINGFYKPHYFELHLKTITQNDICEENKLNVNGKAFSTLVHEYIHYLQDILTLNGLVNINNYICFMKSKLIINQKKFDPTTYKGFSDEDIQNWKKIEQNFGKKEPVSFNINEIKEITNTGNDNYIIRFLDGNYLQLGTIHIIEGMAALGQKIIKHSIEEKHPLNPYQIIYILTRQYYDELHDDLLLFAICEVALSSNNSMSCFIELLQICKKLKIENIEQFIIYLSKDITFQKMLIVFANFIDIVINEMKQLFNDEMSEPKEEFIKTMENSRKKHKDFLLPITQFVISMVCYPDFTFMTTLCEIGEPNFLIKDIPFTFIKKQSNNGSLKYMAFRNIIQNLNKKDRNSCDLMFCPQRNILCKNNVFAKIKNNEQCMYCNLWKSYGLKE